jgi:hypothetical protein
VPQPLFAKVRDTRSGVAPAGVRFTLSDVTAGTSSSMTAASVTGEWYQTANVVFTEGHVYSVAVTATDRAGNATSVGQPGAAAGGGFLAMRMSNLATTARAQASAAPQPCEVGNLDYHTLTRQVTCRDVAIAFPGAPLSLTGTRHGGTAFLGQEASLSALRIHPTVAGSSVGQADLVPLSGARRTAQQRFTVPGPSQAPVAVNTDDGLVVIPQVTATVGAAVDGATIDMAPTTATATSMACYTPGASAAFCSPDPLPAVVDVGGLAVKDVVALPGNRVMAEVGRQGGFVVGAYGMAVAATREIAWDEGSSDSGTFTDHFSVQPPEGDEAGLGLAWAWYHDAGWTPTAAEQFGDQWQAGKTLNEIARGADLVLASNDPPVVRDPQGYDPMGPPPPGSEYDAFCHTTPADDKGLYHGRGCYHRRIGEDDAQGYRYLGDSSFAIARADQPDLYTGMKSLMTGHRYVRGQMVDFEPKVTKYTDCGPGSSSVQFSLVGHGMSMQETHQICRDFVDPDAKDPTSAYSENYTTTWGRNDGNPATGTQATQELDQLKLPANGVGSGFTYQWKAQVGFGGCGLCEMIIWGP